MEKIFYKIIAFFQGFIKPPQVRIHSTQKTSEVRVRLVTTNFLKLQRFWKYEFPKRKISLHLCWEYPFLLVYSLYIISFSVLPFVTKLFLVRLILAIILYQSFFALIVFVVFFSFLAFITFIGLSSKFKNYFKKTYGKRAYFLLNLDKPLIILDSYVKVCRTTIVILIFLWFIFGPIADYANLKYTGWMVCKKLEYYKCHVNYIVANDLTSWPDLPDLNAKYILLPSLDLIFSIIDYFKNLK